MLLTWFLFHEITLTIRNRWRVFHRLLFLKLTTLLNSSRQPSQQSPHPRRGWDTPGALFKSHGSQIWRNALGTICPVLTTADPWTPGNEIRCFCHWSLPGELCSVTPILTNPSRTWALSECGNRMLVSHLALLNFISYFSSLSFLDY